MNPCKHPIVILKDVKFEDLKVIVDFMYYGEVNVSQEQLPAILKVRLNSCLLSIFQWKHLNLLIDIDNGHLIENYDSSQMLELLV